MTLVQTTIRRAAIAKVQIARKDLALDDATYRAMLERLTGQTSAGACTEAQLGLVLDELKLKGWAPRKSGKGPARRPAQTPLAKKARALWISLHQLGVVRDPSEKALEAFGKRQLGVDRLAWADEGLAYRLVEALKAMASRAGWHQDVPADVQRRVGEVLALKRALFRAQEAKLTALDPERMSEAGLAEALDENELTDRIQENGRHINAHLSGGARSGGSASSIRRTMV